MAKITLTKAEARGVLADKASRVRDEIVDTSRWSIRHELIFRREGKLYSVWYQVGATEQQDESPFDNEGDEIECTEMEAYERTIIDYRAAR